ncbi:MAG: hypothetical protein IJT36_07670 [Alphaproteobacteria bacterium]|nr:hypothetical protein [Alphaproteobacteria bacterium]
MVFENYKDRQHWRDKCGFWKTKGSRRGEKVKYWKTIILAADTAENARFGKRQERGRSFLKTAKSCEARREKG